ncbi:MAG: valine--tRNA ligase [Acidobacteria bacterium 13_2_20CM_57_17]|nr:MAG: valine--tRNA ligase [Acidobacteria bacterium 13_2_20CM_57_17]OLB91972.1 MAG: valine--tRNA ligase [Acidobacteria bacterium 13_2_20CM_2_57_12]
MVREIAKAYEPRQIEPRWADFWVKEALFKADVNAPGPVFSIVIPPPNVTGSLHIGHMLEHTEIDILTRWHRMREYNTLYLPGTDHAGISTQRVVVKHLMDRGIDYHTLGREEFERQVWKWKAEAGSEITRQMKGIGESCDWSREKFTLSPEMSRVVREVFVRLYEEGLIYREKRLVNWCPVCLTVLSDLEVVHEERQGHLWYIKYPVVGTKEFLVVATTRPETMLGDTAVAVNPEDERYTHLVGKKALLPLMNREIPILADAMVDHEFGTGAVKITPAHDPNDFEVGRRHKLAEIDVMTDDGKMGAPAGAYAEMDRFEARKKIVEDLRALGLLEKITEHTNAVGLCERSKTIVEPRASTQWFCKMKPLAEPAIAAVERGEIQIVPDNRREEYFNWMRNIRDWTLSRQLWWGHRIPAWYCKENKHVTVAREKPAKCATCGSANLEQDPDVLDTWFSSGLWPFSTLGWPEETADFKKYYPTSLLITGYDILFFWVARMIMMGIHFTGKVPFRAVYLHSLVRTGSGEKMSKSKGTGLDPVALNHQYGTDAMRFCLASMAAPGTDIVLSEDKLASARNFANKIWNAARFLFVNLDKFEEGGAKLEELATPEVRAKAPYTYRGDVPLVDAWMFARLAATIELMNDALANYRFHEAAQGAYQFFWGDFCDWHIEWVKPELQSADRERATVAWKNLFAAFDAALRLLHPFMPFLTEELWHQLPQKAGAKSIALGQFPEAFEHWKNKQAVCEVGAIQEVVTALRNIRAELKLDPKKKVAAEFSTSDAGIGALVQANRGAIERFAVLTELRIVPRQQFDGKSGAVRSTAKFDVRVAYSDTADATAERARLKKEIEGLEKAIASKERQLGDETFRSRAPEKIIKGLEATLAEQRIELRKLKDRLSQLEKNS